ncbi:MAG: hypothetical protein J1E16_04345 [Muribaculaceae bacterium]|nr:hypothetical protein [Muribaculaceae bacterium]
MERDSFIFYRSFYEGLKCMDEHVQLQVFTAIAEYALDGIEPTNLSKEAQGMFHVIRPQIDANNARYTNGKKGAKYGKLGGRPRKNPVPAPTTPQYSCSFKEEADKMKGDEIWLDAVCMQNRIDREELLSRIEAFPIHCEAECSDKPHKDYADAKKHFCSWMRKAYPPQPVTEEPDDIPPPDYTFNGGFNSIDV